MTLAAPSPVLRIVLVDDHTLFRKGLAELLEREGVVRVAAITGNPKEVPDLLRQHRPDVLLLDLNLGGADGINVMQELRNEGFSLPVLMLTVSEAEEDMARALRSGANGYLLKSMEPDEVLDAIARAARGETVVAPAMTAKLVKLLDNKGSNAVPLLDTLTQREREILSHLARGESNKAIARQLDISYDTVKLHVRHILAKLNLSSRVEAAVFAVEHRLSPGLDSKRS
jgi:two-component system nitrate/nitrite response regulator NarL